MLAARFSENIQEDIQRGWSAWMHPNLGGTKEECLEDAELLGINDIDIREFPGGNGEFALVHHDGLSAYELESSTVEAAIEEVKGNGYMDGSGFGIRTIGSVKVLQSIKLEGYIRELHILEIEDFDYESGS